MEWVAALRSEGAVLPVTLSEVITSASSLVGGDDVTDVVANARDRITTGIWCDVYQLPPNDVVQIGSLGELVLSDPVSRYRRFVFRPGSTLDQIGEAEKELDLAIPPRWRAYLTSSSVLHEAIPVGDEGEYVHIYTPADIAGVTNAFYDWTPRCGAIMIGDGGGSDWLQLDTRAGDSGPVVLLLSGGQAWEDTYVQAASTGEFIASVESGEFAFLIEGHNRYQPAPGGVSGASSSSFGVRVRRVAFGLHTVLLTQSAFRCSANGPEWMSNRKV